MNDLELPPYRSQFTDLEIDYGENEFESQLIRYVEERGYIYFVQYADPDAAYYSAYSKSKRADEIEDWCIQQRIDFTYISGRRYYEFAFQNPEDALLFKMKWE